MMGRTSVMGIERKSSIETEPRTLNFDQIQHAREAAIFVVSTRSVEEAMRIFTEGLQPVVSIPMENEETIMDCCKEDFPEDHVRELEFRDVASAPF